MLSLAGCVSCPTGSVGLSLAVWAAVCVSVYGSTTSFNPTLLNHLNHHCLAQLAQELITISYHYIIHLSLRITFNFHDLVVRLPLKVTPTSYNSGPLDASQFAAT